MSLRAGDRSPTGARKRSDANKAKRDAKELELKTKKREEEEEENSSVLEFHNGWASRQIGPIEEGDI